MDGTGGGGGKPRLEPGPYQVEICEKLANGWTLIDVCKLEHMPARSVVNEWVGSHPEFADNYARARVLGMLYWADEIIGIADDARNDWMERERADGSIDVIPDHEHIQRSRLRIDTRKFLMAKVAPHLFGDSLFVEKQTDDIQKLSDRELIERTRLMAGRLGIEVPDGVQRLIEAEAVDVTPEAVPAAPGGGTGQVSDTKETLPSGEGEGETLD